MTGSASLALLQGGVKKEAPVEEDTNVTDAAVVEDTVAEDVTEAEAATEETVEIDVDKLSGTQLDELVVEYKIETPTTWGKMKVGEKRSWLKEQFDDSTATPTEAVAEEAPVTTDGDVTADTEETAEEVVAASDADDDASTVNEPDATPEPVHIDKTEEAAPAPKEDTIVAPSTEVATTQTKKPTAAKKVKALEGEIVAHSAMNDLVSTIENLKEKDARELVGQLSDQVDFTNFKIGGALAKIQAEGWYAPYGSFKDFVEAEYGMSPRKAAYWISIYKSIVENKIDWNAIKDIQWTKLKEIAGILTNENVEKWVELCKTNNTFAITQMASDEKKKLIANASTGQPDEGVIKTITTKTFKVKDDQKVIIESAIEKAKANSGTEFDTVALEYICMDYLGGKQKTTEDLLKELGRDKAFEIIAEAFPEVDITVSEK